MFKVVKSFLNNSNVQLAILFVVLVVVCFFVYLRLSAPDPVDITETAIAAERKRIDDQLDKTRKESEILRDEISTLRDEIDEVKKELAESVREREESHAEINRANSITDIDRILDKGKRRR